MHIYLKLISQIGICGPPKDTVDPIGPSISVANYEFSSENLINQVFAIKLNRMLISGPGRTIYGPFGSQKTWLQLPDFAFQANDESSSPNQSDAPAADQQAEE